MSVGVSPDLHAQPDPHMAAIMARLRALPAADYRTMPIGQARILFDDNARYWTEPKLPIARVDELSLPGPSGVMRARLYHPRPGEHLPLVVFAHGGGWTFGSIDTHDGAMRHLAQESACAVLGMDYRLAPEHPFPAGLEDTLAAIAFAETGALGGDVDAGRIALAGDSAGANLALAALVSRAGSGAAPIRTAALFYGCFAPIFDTDSHKAYGDGSFGLSTDNMRWYWRNFLGSESEAATSLAAPLRADLSALPPLYLNCAGLDPLRDDTYLLSRRLTDAGIRHRLDVFPGVVHGFVRMMRELPAARDALHAAGAFLKDRLNA
jgi:acetyl esterase